jgi:hypothetical protein
MEISKDNLLQILLNDELRKELISLLIEDHHELKLLNHIVDIAESIEYDENTFRSIFKILECEGNEGSDLINAFVINPLFPEDILFRLFEQDKYICSMAHRRGPINLLLKIAREKNGWSEAILSCGYYYYEQDSISIEQFENFMNEFISCYSLLYQFTYKAAFIHNVKNNSIMKIIEKSNYSVELHELYCELKNSIELKTTHNVKFIQEMYVTNNCRYMSAMSINVNCPLDILECLRKIKGVKNAKEIRFNANNTMRKKQAAEEG